MKFIALTSAALLAASTAFAGNVNYEPDTTDPVPVDDTVMAKDEGSSGGSAGWIVPLVAIALVALAITQSDNGGSNGGCVDTPETPNCI